MRDFVPFVLAAGFVLLTVVIVEQRYTGAAWGLVAILLMGALIANPALLRELTTTFGG